MMVAEWLQSHILSDTNQSVNEINKSFAVLVATQMSDDNRHFPKCAMLEYGKEVEWTLPWLMMHVGNWLL